MKDNKEYLPLKIAEKINKKNRIRKGRVLYIIEFENDMFWYLKRPLLVKGKSERLIVNKKTRLIER